MKNKIQYIIFVTNSAKIILGDIIITPVISILIPIYNIEKYVRNAIKSILGQIFTDFELLALNDNVYLR